MTWTSPRTWVAGEKPPATTLNTHIRDNFKAIGDPWTSYTPTLTGITIGNGTLNAAYVAAGKLIHYRIELTWGSTTAGTGTFAFSLPFTPMSAYLTHHPLGTVSLLDTSASAVSLRFARHNSPAGSILLTDAAGVNAATASPWTWATGDTIQVIGTYEAA